MRTIRRTARFKKDYRREAKSQQRLKLDELLIEAVSLLADNVQLPPSYHDHALSGRWKDHRNCHIKPDLVLIYRKPDDERLELVRLGSHSELSL